MTINPSGWASQITSTTGNIAPITSGRWPECDECGALLVDKYKHRRWHEDLAEDLAARYKVRYVPAGSES